MRHIARGAILVGVVFVGLAVGIGAGAPQPPARYFGICSENVENIEIVNKGRQNLPLMVVTLNPKGQQELHEYTRTHIGLELNIVFDGVSLGRSRVYASIGSGIVFSREWRSTDAARAFAKLVRDQAIDAPCGLLAILETDDEQLGFDQGVP